jgi:uncharacterized protein YbaR (Trm112 family)/SAM-dependent methyltransferase
MKPRLLNWLVCPLDRTPLRLIEWEREDGALGADEENRARRWGIDPSQLSTEIISGALVNDARKLAYPIHRGVPRMLTFRTQVTEDFWRRNADEMRREAPGCQLPDEPSKPGEVDVLRTFSSEWVNFDWDAQTYWGLEPEGWFRAMRFILDFANHPVEGKTVLEVGIGIGALADHFARAEGCELLGVDLGDAVNVAYKHFGKNPFLHVVQASVFALPFREATFDFAYSWGVIHHTHSTREAFQAISKMPKKGGRLYVWVYSTYDEERTFVRRNLMRLERVLRPVVWRLPEKAQAVALSPIVPLYLVHQWWQSRQGNSLVRYGFHEAMHAARDRFTPRFAFRHTNEEVSSWFRGAGYDHLSVSGERERPSYVPLPMITGAGVSGIRE